MGLSRRLLEGRRLTIEVHDSTDSRGYRVVMTSCPLGNCGYQFDRGENRADHFEHDHGPEDVGDG